MSTTTIKAQTINNLEESTTLNDSSLFLTQDETGKTTKITVDSMKSIFGATSSASSGGSSTNNDVSFEYDSFSPECYIKEIKKIEMTTTYGNTYYTDEQTITDDCGVFLHVVGCVKTASKSEFIGVQIKSKDGNFYTICEQAFCTPAIGTYCTLHLHFKAYNGLKIRTYVTANNSGFNTSSYTDLRLIRNNKAFGSLSQTYSLTVSKKATSINMYESDEITIPHDGLVRVNGSFATSTTKACSNDKTYSWTYLQYLCDNTSPWVNLSTKQTAYNSGGYSTMFGVFYVKQDSKLRLVTNSIPHDNGKSPPYETCTAKIEFTAINRTEGKEENADLSTFNEIRDEYFKEDADKNIFKFDMSKSPTNIKEKLIVFSQTQIEDNCYIKWSDDIIEKYDKANDNVIEFKYDYGNSSSTDIKTVEINNTLTEFGYTPAKKTTVVTDLNKKSSTVDVKYFKDLLTEVKFGSKVRNITDYAFYNCNNLTEIEIPSTVTTIGGAYTFAMDKNITAVLSKVTFKDECAAVCSTLDNTFSNCSQLTCINLNKLNVTTIGNSAFRNTKVSTIDIPVGCTGIVGSYQFADNKALSTIYFPTTLTSYVESNTYTGCTNMNANTGNIYMKLKGVKNDYIIGDESSQMLNSTAITTEFNNGFAKTKLTSSAVLKNKKVIICTNDSQMLTWKNNNTDQYAYFILNTPTTILVADVE